MRLVLVGDPGTGLRRPWTLWAAFRRFEGLGLPCIFVDVGEWLAAVACKREHAEVADGVTEPVERHEGASMQEAQSP